MEIYSDSPAKKDIINRKPFASQIGKRIVDNFGNNHESVVLGINGSWGSGKSTLLNFIQQAIATNCEKKNIEILVYAFNPWMFSGQEALQREFLTGLLFLLKKHFKARAEWQDWFDKRLDYLKIVKYLPKYGDDAFQAIEKLVKGMDSFGSINELKTKIDEILTQEKTRLYIFIDDLDRLSPDETLEVFKLIKLNMNFKNTVFVVAYDRVVVEHALQHKYGESSKRYMEKIIQIDFKIPEILSEKIQSIFKEELTDFFNQEKIEYDAQLFFDVWEKAGLDNAFRNLRDVYRYLNAISFSLPSIYMDVCITDFLLIEVIRIFDSNGYENLFQKMSARQNVYKSKNSEKFQELKFSDKTQMIVDALLPTGVNALHEKNTGKRRFYDTPYVARYFSMQVSSYDITEKEFEDYLNAQDKLIVLKNISNGERLASFFERVSKIETNFNTVENEIFIIFNSICNLLDESDALLTTWANTAFGAIGNILKSSNDYYKIAGIYVECLCMNVSRLSYSRYLFSYWTLMDYDKSYMNGKASEKNFIDKARRTLTNNQQQYHDNFFSHILNPRTWEQNPYVIQLFMAHYAKEKPEEYQTEMEKLLKIDKCIVFLCRKFAMFIDENGNPRRYHGETYAELLPIPLDDIFKHRTSEVLEVLPDGRNRQLVQFMCDALNGRTEE